LNCFAVYSRRAEDWNLATPLKTCSLLVEQHGDKLHLIFRFLQTESDPNSWTLFAISKIDLKREENGKKLALEYFVENVVDSSRYFVVRIVDERSGREALIGFGFRDRDEATDFRESLQYYKKSILRETEGESTMHTQYDGLGEKLKLGEGEKIHINLGKKSTISKTPDKKKSSGNSGGGGMLLLKKPPPAPKLEKDISISFGDIDINSDISKRIGEESSTAALGEASSAGEEEEDLWQDFEDATSP
jgi:adaptin ear-binding coat-associated protein 1/2